MEKKKNVDDYIQKPTGNPMSVTYCHECPEQWKLDRSLKGWITDEDVERMDRELMFDWSFVLSCASTWMSKEQILNACECTRAQMEWYCMTLFRKSFDECYKYLIATMTKDFDEVVNGFVKEGHSMAMSIAERRARSREEQRKDELRIRVIKDDLGDEED